MTDTQAPRDRATADALTARNIARLAADPFAGIPDADAEWKNWAW